MRKLVFGLAALAAIGVALPAAALADEVIIHKHRDHGFLPPPPHHDKTVIIHHGDHGDE